MPPIEVDTRKIIARLRREGWVDVGGTKHDIFENEKFPDRTLIVPRHKQQSPGVARSIAKSADWI